MVDGPHAHLYNKESKSWVKLMNWQHSSMYLFFGISGIAMLLRTSSKLVPARIDRAALSLALFVEGESPKLFLLYWSHDVCLSTHLFLQDFSSTSTCTPDPPWMLTSTPCCCFPSSLGQSASCWRCSSEITSSWSCLERASSSCRDHGSTR